jgi:hypothetical protein
LLSGRSDQIAFYMWGKPRGWVLLTMAVLYKSLTCKRKPYD